MRFDEAIAELDSRQPESMPEPSLDRIRAICELLDQPQLTFPTIHVTGTNGKTTTARITASVTCELGITTGLYTSPHLLSVLERMSVCGVQMSEPGFAEEYEHLLPYMRGVDEGEHGKLTYFEALTALAFLWFADKPVGLGVVEVGMGGTWDATNVVAGDVAVICPVGLDHRELGDTVSAVAGEKSGIIKPGKICVARDQEPEALRVIEGRAREVGSRLLYEGRDFQVGEDLRAVGGRAFSVEGIHGTYEDLFLPIHGGYAAKNAAASVVAIEALLDREIPIEPLRSGLASATSPGRLEVVSRDPLVILDGAHNPAAASALADAMRETFRWERLHLVVAGFASHDLPEVIARLAPLADVGYAARNSSPRSRSETEALDALRANGIQAEPFASVAEAIAAARSSAEPGDAVLVTGSLYTVADARRAMVRG